jgi:hypothetical protein
MGGLVLLIVVGVLGFSPLFAESTSESLFPPKLFLFNVGKMGGSSNGVVYGWDIQGPGRVATLVLPLGDAI